MGWALEGLGVGGAGCWMGWALDGLGVGWAGRWMGWALGGAGRWIVALDGSIARWPTDAVSSHEEGPMRLQWHCNESEYSELASLLMQVILRMTNILIMFNKLIGLHGDRRCSCRPSAAMASWHCLYDYMHACVHASVACASA